jgi:hypothetical protein
VKNNYWGIVRISGKELKKYIYQLVNNQNNASIIFFRQLDKKFKIIKKQNEKIWWIEIIAKYDTIEKLRFHLSYNEYYLDFTSSRYYYLFNQADKSSIFLGHDLDTINLILSKLLKQFFAIKDGEYIYLKYKNMIPFDSKSEY